MEDERVRERTRRKYVPRAGQEPGPKRANSGCMAAIDRFVDPVGANFQNRAPNYPKKKVFVHSELLTMTRLTLPVG